MNVEVAANKRFLDTSATPAARDWDELLVNQVDLSLAGELSMLLGIEQWTRARTVIDAGCGNGYYLAELSAFFPEKRYLGIDISTELIAAAALRHPRLDFVAADFFAAKAEPTDAMIMRFLVQHLGDFAAVLRGARRLLRPGGALIIVEADLGRSIVRPLPAAFHRMLLTYNEASAADGGFKGRLLADIDTLVAETGEPWRVATIRESAIARTGPFAGSSLNIVFGKWVDLAERSAMFAFDFATVRAELRDWAAQRHSLVNLVTRMFVLEPTA